MKKLFLLLCLVTVVGSTFAQDEQAEKKPWTIKGETGITYSNAYFGNYWAAGGDNSNSLLWRGLLNMNWAGEKGKWDNTIDLSYGLLQQGDQGVRKMNDKIDVLSKYSINGFSEKWRYTALLNFKTQFTEGFKYEANKILVSDFFAPAYLTASVGIEYLGDDRLKIFFSPFSEKTTIVKEAYYDKKIENKAIELQFPDGVPSELEGEVIEPDPFFMDSARTILQATEVYGLAWRDNIKTEIGALAQIIYDHPDMIKGFGLKTRLDLFGAYEHLNKIDVDWELWLTFQFNKYLSVNINTQMIYDDDIRFEVPDGSGGTKYSPKIQFRNLLGVGLVYTFNNQE
ncbi:DUF3078 domain-containing protein [Saccharicrinis sp. FJH54]|uniref:DUF3078 domain-containing protein n=1 Tax=Saccharicrinis sp. FJH54 TaxID=3344665 RepID=UPI0035D4EF67